MSCPPTQFTVNSGRQAMNNTITEIARYSFLLLMAIILAQKPPTKKDDPDHTPKAVLFDIK